MKSLVVQLIIGSLLLALLTVSAAAPNDPAVPKLAPVGPSTFRPPKIIGWPDGKTPKAPPGFVVRRFAENLDSPRWLLVLPNGDVLVSQSRSERMSGMPDDVIQTLTRLNFLGPSANNIILLRKTDGGVTQSTLIKALNLPHGM